jgi:hypothetical protein
MSWSDFVLGGVQNIVAGLVIAAGVYLVVDRKLNLRRDRDRRAEFVRGILEMIRLELTDDVAIVEIMQSSLPQGQLPLPGFQTTCADLVLQAEVFTALSPDTTRKLLFAYNRLQSANELHSTLSEARHGVFALVAHLGAKMFRGGGDEALAQREQFQEKFLERCDELLPHVQAALNAVNRDMTRLP